MTRSLLYRLRVFVIFSLAFTLPFAVLVGLVETIVYFYGAEILDGPAKTRDLAWDLLFFGPIVGIIGAVVTKVPPRSS